RALTAVQPVAVLRATGAATPRCYSIFRKKPRNPLRARPTRSAVSEGEANMIRQASNETTLAGSQASYGSDEPFIERHRFHGRTEMDGIGGIGGFGAAASDAL